MCESSEIPSRDMSLYGCEDVAFTLVDGIHPFPLFNGCSQRKSKKVLSLKISVFVPFESQKS